MGWGAQEFSLEVYLRNKSPAGSQSPPRVTVNFRPAASETFGQLPQIGIPGFVPWNNQLPSYFFATVQRHAASACDAPAIGRPTIGSANSVGRYPSLLPPQHT